MKPLGRTIELPKAKSDFAPSLQIEQTPWSAIARRMHEVMDKIEAVPGVRNAATTSALRREGRGCGMPFLVEGQQAVDRANRPGCFYKMVSPSRCVRASATRSVGRTKKSDTPRKAGGLMSGAASKAVTQVHRLSPCGVLGGRPQEKLSDLLQCASFKGLRLTAGQQLRLLPLLSSIEIGEVAIKGSKATVKPLRVSLVEPVAYLLRS